MFNKFSIFFYLGICIIFFILTACEYECNYSYVVSNKTTGSIHLTVEGEGEWSGSISGEFDIPKNSEKILLIDQTIHRPYDKENHDTIKVFTIFEVVKNDTVPCISDFKKRNKWIYVVTSEKHHPYGAKYTAEVSDDDF
jgi:hypothetical protein